MDLPRQIGQPQPMRAVLLLALTIALVAAFAAHAGWREATAVPIVVRYTVAVDGWPARQAPLRLVQLSDTHGGAPDMPPARLDALVAQVNTLKPDLVVLTGDYHGGKLFNDRSTGSFDSSVLPFARLRSRFGTFAVRGNHDEAYWAPVVIPRYRITYLQNRWADAGPVVIAGLDDLRLGHPDIAAALAGVPRAKPVILLMHEPDSFPEVPPRVALTLAGHTHGGQIMLPVIGAPVTNSRFGQRYRRGLIVEGGRRMIVSSGVGTSALPLRLGVPPEIVVVDLYSTGRNSGTDR